MVFLKLMHMESQLNHKTLAFWVKVVQCSNPSWACRFCHPFGTNNYPPFRQSTQNQVFILTLDFFIFLANVADLGYSVEGQRRIEFDREHWVNAIDTTLPNHKWMELLKSVKNWSFEILLSFFFALVFLVSENLRKMRGFIFQKIRALSDESMLFNSKGDPSLQGKSLHLIAISTKNAIE